MAAKKTKKKAAKRATRKSRAKATPTPAEPRGPGRPKGSTEPVPADLADEVIDWLSGGKELEDYCRQEGKPCKGTIHNWRHKDADFDQRFARAREAWALCKDEEALAVARTPLEGEVVTEEYEPEVVDSAAKGKKKKASKRKVLKRKVVRDDMLGHRKLLVSTLLTISQRVHGNKVKVEHSGSLEALVSESMDPPPEGSSH